MKKAIWSGIYLDNTDKESVKLFIDCVDDLVNSETVKKLDNFTQHHGTSRLQHCINVAYYSFLISRRMNLDYRSAARAGMLHDLYLYDWRVEKQPEGNHAAAHPIVALRNAKSITSLNPAEEDAIVNHMWPITPVPPKYMVSYIVCFVDKYCACAEVMNNYAKGALVRSAKLKYKMASALSNR